MHMVLQTLDREGVSVDKLNQVLTTQNSTDPLAQVSRVKGSHFIKIVDLLIQQPEPYFTVKVGEAYRPFTFNVLGPLCYSCQTLKENINYLTQYHSIITTGASCYFEQENDLWCLRVDSVHDAFERNLVALSWLGIMLSHFRFSLGDSFTPIKVTSALRRPSERDVLYIENSLKLKVEFDAPHTAIYFTDGQLDIQQMGFDEELKSVNLKLVKQYQKKFEQFELPVRIYHCILSLIKQGIFNKTAVARELGVSTRSLSLKIRQFGINYRNIAEQARMEMAKEFLQDPQMKLIEIAERLCFSENSNFSRAFKAHTGMTPRYYRNNYLIEEYLL